MRSALSFCVVFQRERHCLVSAGSGHTASPVSQRGGAVRNAHLFPDLDLGLAADWSGGNVGDLPHYQIGGGRRG